MGRKKKENRSQLNRFHTSLKATLHSQFADHFSVLLLIKYKPLQKENFLNPLFPTKTAFRNTCLLVSHLLFSFLFFFDYFVTLTFFLLLPLSLLRLTPPHHHSKLRPYRVNTRLHIDSIHPYSQYN